MKHLLAAAFLVLLAGCAPPGRDWGAIQAQSQDIRAACEREEAGKSRLKIEGCANIQIRDLYASAGFRDMDILDAYLSQRMSIAERQDAGKISALEVNGEMAQAKAAANSAEQARATNRAAAAAIMAPVTCTRYGNTATCY